MSKEKKQKIKNVNKPSFLERRFSPIIKACFDKSNYIAYVVLFNYCKDNNYQVLTIDEFSKLVEIYTKKYKDNDLFDFPILFDDFIKEVYSNNNDDIN